MFKLFSLFRNAFGRRPTNLSVVGNHDTPLLNPALDLNELSADQSVSTASQDRFQRYNFAKRIAETILDRSMTDCIVLGIYGAWGEGKTSVLNFIEKNLDESEKVSIVKFNPWRYPDENTLLMNFFGILANSLDKNLKTGVERVGKYISEYSSLLKVSSFVDVSGSIKKIGDKMDEKGPEELKKRINNFILKSGKKLIIFIDDIDRLEKTEVHIIFRLVKLTADFINTVYVLSFDDDMVAAAIGERFGQGDQQAGRQFLEKIIQVPLRIPLAQPEALRLYCIEMTNQLLDTQGIKIDDDEGGRYVGGFASAIQPQLKTPRLAVRYNNSLAFSIPLLVGEVNIVDLMLIEAVKIFYPLHYQFIRMSPEYFVNSYNSVFSEDLDDEKVARLKEHLKILSSSLNASQIKGIEQLFRDLFPYINAALTGNRYNNKIQDNITYLQKRICSEHYFKRYFTYAVIEGELSDKEFENLLIELKSAEETAINKTYPNLFKTANSQEIVRKIRSREQEYEWEEVCLITKMLVSSPKSLQDDRFGGIGRSFSPFIQSIICIVNMVSRNKNKTESFQLIKSMLEDIEDVNYSLEIIRWFSITNKDNPVFDLDQLNIFGSLILAKTLDASGSRPLHETYPNIVYQLYTTWRDTDRKGFDTYILKHFQKDERCYIKILYALGPQLSSGGKPSYYSNINDKHYAYITELIDPKLIKNQIIQNYTENELFKEQINWDEHWGLYQSDENMVRQFMFWYRKIEE